MTVLYRTSDMAAAIRLMMARNRESLILKKYNNLKRVWLRLNMIEGLDLTIARPWDSFYIAAVEGWRERGGLLQYHYDRRWPDVPAADAMFVVEAQPGYSEFVRNTQTIRHEVIVYKPPNWKLHDDTIDFNHPGSGLVMSAVEAIRALADRPLLDRHAAVLDHYYPGASDGLVPFEADEIIGLLGTSDLQFKRVMTRTPGIRNTSTPIYGYSLLVRPDSPDLQEVYDLLEAQPDIHKGERLLKSNALPGMKMGVFRTLKTLSKAGNIRRRPKIYIARPAKMRPDYQLIDALGKVARDEWAKLKELIDNAPEYQ